MLLTLHCHTVFLCSACSAQQLALKDSGDPMWFHPSRLTSGGQYATTRALGGSISIRNTSYSRYTVGQLMSPAGLLL
jgi:hypothetical protein